MSDDAMAPTEPDESGAPSYDAIDALQQETLSEQGGPPDDVMGSDPAAPDPVLDVLADVQDAERSNEDPGTLRGPDSW